jgi:hyperosmotically inducible protein
MRRTCEISAMVVVIVMSLGAFGSGQSAQPPVSSEPVPGQNGAAAQPPAGDETMSAETQAKLVNGIRRAIIMLPYYGVFDNIGFRLHERTVTLEGQVVRSSLKPDAERAVKKVEGVEKVINNIEVLPPGPLDEQLRHQVYQAIYQYGPLFKYANMPNPPIHIIVRNANVTVVGVVDTETDKGLVSMRVKQVPDALNVTNDLRVVKP